jgi:hypothetical protein
VIGELGVRSPEGKPYPSTGFTSVYVMAHEIGHNLGRIQLRYSDWSKFLISRHFILAPFFCHNIRITERILL